MALSTFRKEVHEYVRSCEYLLSAVLTGNPPMSGDEREMITYYMAEMRFKILEPVNDHSERFAEGHMSAIRQSVREYVRLSEKLLEMEDLSDEEQRAVKDTLVRLAAGFPEENLESDLS